MPPKLTKIAVLNELNFSGRLYKYLGRFIKKLDYLNNHKIYYILIDHDERKDKLPYLSDNDSATVLLLPDVQPLAAEHLHVVLEPLQGWLRGTQHFYLK